MSPMLLTRMTIQYISVRSGWLIKSKSVLLLNVIRILSVLETKWKQLKSPSGSEWINCGTSIRWNATQQQHE